MNNDQSYGYPGSLPPRRRGCGYNCLCDNCCKKMQDKRDNDPVYRAGERHRQEMFQIMRGKGELK